MPTASSSQGGTLHNGLKRINTRGSVMSGHTPRSSGSGRMSLHIPNAYPRATSPRLPNSTNVIPKSSRPASPSGASEHSAAASTFGELNGGQEQSSTDNEDRACGNHASGARPSSRGPRIRVFRRDSSLITFQQLDDDETSSGPVPPHTADGAEVHIRPTTMSGQLLRPFQRLKDFFSTKHTSSSSARDFLARERNFFVWLRLSCLLAILSASFILQLHLPNTAHGSLHEREPRRRRQPDEAPVDWDNLPLSSKTFAAIFFALSLLALGTGLADYLSAERQLEKEQVDFDETEGVFLNDGRTSSFVHAVMFIVGAGIIASALWLLAY